MPQRNYYTTTATGASIVAGTTRIDGTGCNDCAFAVALPFAYTLYDQSYGGVNVGTNGNLQFVGNSITSSNACVPRPDLNFAILAHQQDLSTVNNGVCPGGLCGIYTSVSGVAPTASSISSGGPSIS